MNYIQNYRISSNSVYAPKFGASNPVAGKESQPQSKEQEIKSLSNVTPDYGVKAPMSYTKTGELKISDNTLAIHHFDGSWLSSEEHYKNELTRKVHKKLPMIPVDLVSMVCAFTAATKFNGILVRTFNI